MINMEVNMELPKKMPEIELYEAPWCCAKHL